MINENDYNAGWTKKAINPRTGKTCSGGAARNLKLAMSGGATGVESAAAMQTFLFMQPMFNDLQNQLQQSNDQVQQSNLLIQQMNQLLQNANKNHK